MNSFKENILQLLNDTGYVLKINPTNLSFVESPFTSWFNQNVSKENCITEEELTEFKSLQESGEVLYGEELEDALQEYYDAGAIIPVDESFEDIKQDELEHTQHQLELQKQLVCALKSSLHSLRNNYCDLQEQFQKVEAQKFCVLKKLSAANNELNIALKQVKDTLNSLVEDITELSQELSADEGIDTCSSDKLKSSALSNSSILSTTSTFSTSKVINKKYMCQIPLNKYNKQHNKFCKLLKNILQKHLSEMEFEGSQGGPQLLIQNIMDRLFRQKLMFTKLIAELEGITVARNKVQEQLKEIKIQAWKPTQAVLRTKIAELEESSILNESESSLMSSEEELNEVCKKWADLQVLKPICDGLQEKIEWAQTILTKLDELASIMSMKLALDVQLCEKIQMEHDLVSNIIDVYNGIHGSVAHKLEATRSRNNVMEENMQDYNNHCANSRRKLIECLAGALGCDTTGVPEAYSLLTNQSHNYHEELVHSYRQQLQTLASVHKNLKDFYFEEEENRLRKLQMPSNQEHCYSLKESLELISYNIEDANMLCQTLLENKENMVQH